MDGTQAVGAVLVFRDVSERIAAERQVAHNAFHDQLTGLPNRRLFLDRLEQSLLRAQRSGAVHAVLMADIDRFKVINDNLGQRAGDELLEEIARRIGVVARPSDTLARFGGDEFTLLAEDIGDVVPAQRLAARIVQELATPIVLSDGREVVTTVSIGIATTDGQATGDDILHDADVAMSQAKANGTGGVHCYDPSAMRARSVARFDLETDLRAAIGKDELEVYYQPKVDLQQGTIRDVEALIRWPDKNQGLRMPGEFIPIAEESGLILPLGRFVLTQASQQAHLWEAIGAQVSVAVNLSARQFQDPGLIRQIETALRMSELPPERLCLEITESLAMQDLELTVRTLGQLKALGVELAIDDFGTGHSSLNYLKRFPVDEVKIDRSFVRDLDSSQVDRAIVAAIVGLANALDIRTVVEGIEDAAQLERVRELGCSLAQGYFVSMPQPAELVGELLTREIPLPRNERRTIDLVRTRSPR
ncbi:MAG: bifunctional diguanylate cyclase/phosphodiesterase [Gemmatimonadetes bacterium]|nr:bifunctional diguanylate cyclase/phosphodiesterase [Gemmatimonadota bacterium]